MSTEQPNGTPGSGAVSDRMRALLSRAAEEQLLEQRQVSAVLGELRTLVQDVDERLATGEQVERLAAEVGELSARVEAGQQAAQARSTELAARIDQATAVVASAAQDLVDAVADRVAQRAEASLRELAAASGAVAADTERRLAVHVDDAVLALAEVVLRRGRPAAHTPVPAAPPAVGADAAPPVLAASGPDAPAEPVPAAEPAPVEVGRPPGPGPVGGAGEPQVADPLVDGAEPGAPSAPVDGSPPADDGTDAPPADAVPADAAAVPGALAPVDAGAPGDADAPFEALPEDRLPAVPVLPADDPVPVAAPTAPHVPDGPPSLPSAPPTGPAPPREDPSAAAAGPDIAPVDGFVLVPADVAEPVAGPAAPPPDERRTADRRTSGRADGSGRRLRPWWRPA